MALVNAAISHFETVERRLHLSSRLRRLGAALFLLLVGWFDYLTPPELTWTPVYLLALIPIAFLEPVPVCLVFSLLAAVIYFAADVLSNPGSIHLIFPYWTAFARLIMK